MKGISRWFTVEGLNLERFVRMAGQKGIRVAQMRKSGRRLHLLAQETDFPRLQALAEQGGWAWKAGERSGLGRRLDMLRRRWVLPACALACTCGIILGMQVMWQVEILGAGSYQADVETYLADCGITAPIWKSRVEPAKLREKLEWRYPRIAWVECGWRGTTLQIRLVEGLQEGESLSASGAGDVVASRGGIVDSVITAAGTAQVAPGQVIIPGQVLIEGWERGEGETRRRVMARGIVLARVWDSASVRMSCVEHQTRSTGRQQLVRTIQGPWFSLGRQVPSPYAYQDVQRTVMPLGGLFIPFTLVMEQRMEAECVPHRRSLEQVKAEASQAAMRILQEKMDFDDELVDKWVEYCMIEDEVVEAVAYGERLMDVALPKRSQ